MEEAQVVVTFGEVLDAFKATHEEYMELTFEEAASTAVVVAAAQIMWLRLYANKELVSASFEIAEAALADAFGTGPTTDTLQ